MLWFKWVKNGRFGAFATQAKKIYIFAGEGSHSLTILGLRGAWERAYLVLPTRENR